MIPLSPIRLAPAILLLMTAPALAQDTSPGVRGVIRAPARVALRTDLAATILDVHKRDGEAFSKDEPLISFDCARLEAERKAASARRRAAGVEYGQKAHLLKHGAAGKGEVDLASAQVALADAEIELAQSRMADCVIEAPFDGRIVETHVAGHEMPDAGSPLLTVIDDSCLEIELVVPSRWLSVLSPGQTFPFAVDETATVETARIERIGAEVDPVSQTVMIIAVFEQRPAGILAGMSGSARFEIADDEG